MRWKRKRKPGGNYLSGALFIHLFMILSVMGIFLTVSLVLCLKTKAAVPCLILLTAATLALAAELVSYFRNILKTVIEIEQKIEVLRQENGHGEEGEHKPESKDCKLNMVETIQILLQKEAAANIMKQQAEIDALQNQINPHFLYNTLETIRGQAICCGASEIAETTKALADIFRFNISKKGTMIYLTEELANVEAYMKIQKIRFSDRFELQMEVEDDILSLRIPKLLIQPLVENALKHGLELKRGKGQVKVRGFRTEDSLIISVSDDGLGMSLPELEKLNRRLSSMSQIDLVKGSPPNVGLCNISNRIRMIYGMNYGVDVRSIPNAGTTVTLTLGILEDEADRSAT